MLNVYYKYTMNKQILYDFPKLPSQKINSIFSGNVQYSVIGKENQPNIFIVNKSQKRGFVSKNVYIFSNINNVDANSSTGELVIEHDAITNGGKKLYLCVPLITNHYEGTYGSPNVLDELIQDSKPMDEIEINSILPENSDCYYYETKGAIVLVFKTAIAVQSHFTGFSQGKIKDIQKSFLETSRYEIVPASKIVSKTTVPRCTANLLVSNKSENNIGADYREGFSEGLTDNTTTSWMECDNVDLDYASDVPIYSVTSGSNMSDPNTIIRIGVGMLFALFGFLLFLFGFPMVYFNVTKIMQNNFVPQIFIALCGVLGIILFIVASVFAAKGETNTNDFVISGVTFFVFFLFSLIYLKFGLIDAITLEYYGVQKSSDEPLWYYFNTPVITKKQ